MEFQDLERMCERAGKHVFSVKKYVLTASALLLSVLLVLLSFSLSLFHTMWGAMSPLLLLMLGVFLVLLSIGIVLIANYHDEVTQRDVDISEVLVHAGKVLM